MSSDASILGLSITDTTPQLVGAGFWIRALARLVDTVYSFIVGQVAGLNAGIILAILQALSIVDPGWLARLREGHFTIIVSALIGDVVYHTLSEGICGTSVGKLVCGLRVLSEDRTPCRITPALKRSIAYYLDSLVWGVIGYLEMKKTLAAQRHGDHWGKTVVMKKSNVPEPSKPSGWRILLGIMLGSAGYCACMIAVVIYSSL